MSVITEEKTIELSKHLWESIYTDEPPKVFAILDGSRDTSIERMLNTSGLKYSCLYEGKLTYDLATAAPYIVELVQDHPFTYELIQKAWGNYWGIFAITHNQTSLATVRRNCRKIAYILNKSNKKFVFRYFDPRVMRVYLPTCTDLEAHKVFGPVTDFVMETKDRENLHRFVRTNLGIVDISNNDMPESVILRAKTRAAKFNILKLRDEQFQAFKEDILEKDYQSIKTQFINDFVEDPQAPVIVNQKPVPLDIFLRSCLKEALKFKLNDHYNIYSFFHLNHTHGWRFWELEENAWAKSILESPRKGEIKIEKLEQTFSSRLMDQLWSA